jgi:hypothetical protein
MSDLGALITQMDERLFNRFGASERFGVSQNIDHCHPKLGQDRHEFAAFS